LKVQKNGKDYQLAIALSLVPKSMPQPRSVARH
jgi:hypothetical protein